MTNKQKSITAMMISAFGFAWMGVFVKLAGDIPVVQKAWIRSIIIMLTTFIMFKMSGLKFKDIGHRRLLLLRSTFGTIGILLNYYALDRLILSDASVLFRLSTVLLLIFCRIFLHEKINVIQLTAIIIAFIGVMFVIKPAFSVEIVPYIAAFLGATFAAAAYTTVRKLGKSEHPLSVVVFFATFTCLVLTPYVLINYEPMAINQLIYAVLAGLCASIGQVGVTAAYKYAPAKEVSIYGYFSVVFSAILSIFIFEMVPDTLSFIGYGIIFASAYFTYRYNAPAVKAS